MIRPGNILCNFGHLCVGPKLFEASLFVFVFIYIGLWIALRPLGPDEIFFLHGAWSINVEGASPYSAYPFAIFPVFLSYLVSAFGFTGTYCLKFVVLALYALIYLRITHELRLLNRLVIASCFVLLFYLRALDLRPELVSTLLSVLVIFIWRERESRGLKVLSLMALEFFMLGFMALVSPRYAVVSVFFGLVCLFDYRSNKKILALGLLLATFSILVLYSVSVGDLRDLFSNSLAFRDLRDPISAKEKIVRLMGGRGLIPYLLLISVVFFWIERSLSEKLGLLTFLLSISTYMGFVLLADRLPYEYSSLPIVLFLIAYWGVSQSCSLRQIGIDCGHWKVLLATILSVFALLYFVKDAKKGWSEVFGYSQAIYADDFENQAISNDRRSPFQQIEIAERLCKKYPGYAVYVDHYRWSPMCLPDQYSGLVWAESLSRTIVIGRISEAKHTAFLNEEGRGIWFYMRP